MTKYTTPHSLPIIEPAVDRIAAAGNTNLAGDINALSVATNAAFEARVAAEAEQAGRIKEQADRIDGQDVRATAIEEVLDGPQIPKKGDPGSWGVQDNSGKVALGVNPSGSTNLGNVEVVPSKDFIIQDRAGKMALGVSRTGENLVPGTGGIPVTNVMILPCLGQSNGVAYSAPTTPEMDLPDPRIWQLPVGGSGLVPAVTPLTGQGTTPGLAPGHVFAKEFLKDAPQGTMVVLLPLAVGGTGLGLATTSSSGVWSVDYTGTARRLFQTAVTTTLAAYTAAKAKWNLEPVYLAATWNQGEQDAADLVNRATYEAELDKLISTFRTRIGSNIPFIIGGMVPEWVEEFGTAPRANIRKALLDTPRRVERTAYADGIRNAGGSAGIAGDLVHYSREGIIRLGRAMYRELLRAQNNTAASKITAPLDLAATIWNGELEATWTAPTCRHTGYEIQTSPNGTTWTTLARPDPMETRHTAAVAGPVKVRVRAINDGTSSMYTTAVKAIGA